MTLYLNSFLTLRTRFLAALAVLFFMSLLISTAASAKIPESVLTPYRAYTAALEQGDMKTASAQARLAWERAEEELGDHKTTGDLAQNFADVKDESTFKLRSKAFQRSVELAMLHGEDATALAVERQIKLAQMHLFESRIIGSGRRAVTLAKDMIETYDMSGTMFDGEIKTLDGMQLSLRGKEEDALITFDAAIKTFENVDERLPSVMPYLAKLYRADLLNVADNHLEALLQYQEVMQNVEGIVESDHPFVRKAFSQWLKLRGDFEADGKMAEIEAAGVCECWPYEDYKNKIEPLERMPPKMPRQAQRSGWVIVQFDVTDDGKTENVESITATERVFVRDAVDAVSKWTYPPKTSEEPNKARKAHVTTITFYLMDERGNQIPEF